MSNSDPIKDAVDAVCKDLLTISISPPAVTYNTYDNLKNEVNHSNVNTLNININKKGEMNIMDNKLYDFELENIERESSSKVQYTKLGKIECDSPFIVYSPNKDDIEELSNKVGERVLSFKEATTLIHTTCKGCNIKQDVLETLEEVESFVNPNHTYSNPRKVVVSPRLNSYTKTEKLSDNCIVIMVNYYFDQYIKSGDNDLTNTTMDNDVPYDSSDEEFDIYKANE